MDNNSMSHTSSEYTLNACGEPVYNVLPCDTACTDSPHVLCDRIVYTDKIYDKQLEKWQDEINASEQGSDSSENENSGTERNRLKIWIGAQNDPNLLAVRPWYGNENEDQTEDGHVNDYYVSPNMTYYCFVKTLENEYVWSEITDINLKKLLAEINRNTAGFVVDYSQIQGVSDINSTVADYFSNRDYRIGDLWSNAKYTITLGGQTSLLYDGELLICTQNKSGEFNIDDWEPASDTKRKLYESGIDVDGHKIVITAEQQWKVSDGQEEINLINFVNGQPKINTDLLHIDNNVEIDGNSIVDALGDSSEAQENLIGLLQNNNIVPVNVTDNDGDTIVIQSDDNQYVAYTKQWVDDNDFVQFDTKHGGESSSFTLNKNGLLEADNAIIRGEIHATSGSFEGTLQSAGGAFNVDNLGNVTATSFRGTGILTPGTTVITKDNFYEYFVQSQLDIDNGPSLDEQDFPYNSRWIPNLRKLNRNIYFDSVPQEVLYVDEDDQYDTPWLYIVWPHYFYEKSVRTNGEEVKSCRRGEMTYQELVQLNGETYTISQKQDPDMNIAMVTTLCPDNETCGDYLVLTTNQRTNAQITTLAQIQYNIRNNIDSVNDTYYGGVYASLVTKGDVGVVSQWCDIEPNANADNDTTDQPDIPINGDVEYNITAHLVSRSGNTFCFMWECPSKVDIEQIGVLALPGYYTTQIQENGHTIQRYALDVVSGEVVYGELVSGTVVPGTAGQYQSGYFCVTANKEISQTFRFANISLAHTVDDVTYNITV